MSFIFNQMVRRWENGHQVQVNARGLPTISVKGREREIEWIKLEADSLKRMLLGAAVVFRPQFEIHRVPTKNKFDLSGEDFPAQLLGRIVGA